MQQTIFCRLMRVEKKTHDMQFKQLINILMKHVAAKRRKERNITVIVNAPSTPSSVTVSELFKCQCFSGEIKIHVLSFWRRREKIASRSKFHAFSILSQGR